MRCPSDCAHALPDGRTIAAGGWTGWDWDRQGAVYLFDAESGEMTRRLGGFPDVIGALAFSRDGRRSLFTSLTQDCLQQKLLV